MTKTRIFSALLLPIIIILGWALYRSIASTIELAEAIKASESRVINRLKVIREVEKTYLADKGGYTADWDSLIDFVKYDSIPIVEKIEIIQERTPDDPLYYTRTDSIRIEFDTLDVIPAKQSIMESLPQDLARRYKSFNWDNLPYVPGYEKTEDKKFEIFADKIEKSNVMVDVIEVIDPYPMDESRSDENISPVRWRLRFGSKTEVTTAGNWE